MTTLIQELDSPASPETLAACLVGDIGVTPT